MSLARLFARATSAATATGRSAQGRRLFGVPPSIWWCLLVLVLVESLVRVAFVRVSNFGQLAHLRDKMANIQALDFHPQVLFLGNSVAREGVDPWAYQEASGQAAYNLGASDGTFYLMRKLYLTHRDQRFSQLKAAFFLINPPDLKVRRLPEVKDSRFMSLREKMSANRHLSEWLLSELSHTYAYRDEIFYQIKLLLSGKGQKQVGFEANEDARGFAPRQLDGQLKTDLVRLETLRVMSDYRLPGYQFDALLALTSDLLEMGVDIYWVNPPLPAEARAVLAGELASDFGKFERLLDDAAHRLGVRRLKTSEVFADDCFYDFLHLKPACARRYAFLLAEMARSSALNGLPAPAKEARQR